MELKLVANLSKEDYDRFVMEHASGSFLQSWDWGQWMADNGRQLQRLAVTDSAGSIFMSAQIFRTAIPKIGGHYIYIPYGPILNKSATEEILIFFFAQLREKFPSAMFVRVEPKQQISIAGKPTKHIQPGKTLVLDLTKTEDELLGEMHQKTRYNIKVAQRHGVEIKTGTSSDALELIDKTSARQGYKNHPLNYYQKMVGLFNGGQGLNIKVYSAHHGSQILASAIMVDYGTTRTYLFGGTSDLDRNVMAPYLLHWQAITDAQKLGLKTYDFWGIETASGKTPGFVRFKLGWGGMQIQYPAPLDIVYKPLWYNAYKLLRSLNRKLS
jgi:lipid II:glycine glycyltransferase (peptidoglycan interpeptide bridge formation enzyme)